jgi:hypothetical protein
MAAGSNGSTSREVALSNIFCTMVLENRPPVWSTVPNLSAPFGASLQVNLLGYASDPEGDPMAFSSVGAALPTGWSIVGSELRYSGGGSIATTAGIRLRATASGGSTDSNVFSVSIVNLPPVWGGTPAPLFQVGVSASYPLLPFVSDPEGDSITFASIGTALPSGVTINNTTKALDFSGAGSAGATSGARLRATATGGQADSAVFGINISPAGAAVDVTALSLTSAVGGTLLPFTVGHAFRRGDVPAGTHVTTDLADAQATPTVFWPDGSVKHAIIAGRCTLTANVAGSVIVRRTPTAPTGAALTTAQLAAAMPTVTITGGAHTTTLNSLLASPHRTVVAGPVMSNWIYRQPVAGSAHLVVWVDVRYYAGGQIEIFPWVENAYFLVASPINDVRTWGVTINGVSRFSQSIDIKHRTRVPLISGAAHSYWVGADPAITPAHDISYLKGTYLVPNYGFGTPSAATLNALQQSYTPNTLAGVNSAMGSAGSSAALIPNSQVFYITSNGDARAWRAMVAHGLSGGSWSVHYRDEGTNDPIKFSSYPGASLQGGTPAIPAGTGGTNGTHVTTHQPSYGYLPYLLTGRWWFLEESMFWTTSNYLSATTGQRTSGSAIIDPRNGTYANRGAHWSLRTLAQTFALCPTTHGTYVDWKAAWENNTAHYRATYVDSGAWVSPQGKLGEYSSGGGSLYPPAAYAGNAWYGAAWMDAFGIQTWGFASDLGLDQSATSLSNHIAVRNQAYKQVVGRADDGLSGRYNWRRFIVYGYPIGTDATGLPPETWFTHAQSYAEYCSGFGLPTTPSGSNTLKSHSSDIDLAAGTSSSSDYGPFALSALAYAVSHGAPGAVAGWNRVSGASNFALSFAGLVSNPEHGVIPRVLTSAPSHIAAAAEGQWTAIGSNTMTAVSFNYAGWGVPGFVTNLQAMLNAWSGGTYDPVTHRLYVNGGGHNDYDGNETYAFNLETNSWSRLDNPSPYDEDAFTGGGPNNPLGWDGVFPDNGPQPIHTYEIMACNPTSGRVYRIGRSGSVLQRIQEFTPSLAVQQTPGAARPSWSYKAIISWQDPSGGATAWMADEGQFLIAYHDNGTFINFRRYNPTTDTVSAQLSGGGAFYGGDKAMAYSPARRLAVLHRRQTSTNTLVLFNSATNTASTQAVTGATLPSRCGLEYDIVRDRFVAYSDEEADRRVLYSINPDTWVATAITPSAGATPTIPPNLAGYRGIYGRFAYCAEYDVFIAFNSVSGSVFLYKPVGWSPP